MSRILVLAVLLIPTVVSAQTQTQTPAPRPPIDDPTTMALQTRDPPRGFPYRTGDYSSGEGPTAQVPLRDFLSSRQDQQRAELIERIESQGAWLQRLLDERDRQYAQRFIAQQTATEAALASAKEAVDKAEAAASDRFDSVNEWRRTVEDLSQNFVNKSTADARHSSLEEKVNDVVTRLNLIQGQREGGAETWVLVLGLATFAIGVLTLLYNAAKDRDRRPTSER